MEYLRPCPFCGSDAVLEDLGGAGIAGRYFIRCPKCKIAQDALWVTKKTAVKRWNRRFPATGQHGKWIWDDEGYHCSECWYHAYGNTWEVMSGEYRYCPNCGVQMEERSEDETG